MSSSDGGGKQEGGEIEGHTPPGGLFLYWGDVRFLDLHPFNMETARIRAAVTAICFHLLPSYERSLNERTLLINQLTTQTDTGERALTCGYILDVTNTCTKQRRWIDDAVSGIVEECKRQGIRLNDPPMWRDDAASFQKTYSEQERQTTVKTVLDHIDDATIDTEIEGHESRSEQERKEVRILRSLQVPADKLDDDCPICLNKVVNPAAISCQHVICAKCISDHRSKIDTMLCPLCKLSLDDPETQINDAKKQVRTELTRLGLDYLMGEYWADTADRFMFDRELIDFKPDVIESYYAGQLFEFKDGDVTTFDSKEKRLKVALLYSRLPTDHERKVLDTDADTPFPSGGPTVLVKFVTVRSTCVYER